MITNNVWTVPLIFHFHWSQQQSWITVVVKVTAKQAALSAGRLQVTGVRNKSLRKQSKKKKIVEKVISSHQFHSLSSAQHFIFLSLWQRVFGSFPLSVTFVQHFLLGFFNLLLFLCLSLLLQLELKVLQVPIGSVVIWV